MRIGSGRVIGVPPSTNVSVVLSGYVTVYTPRTSNSTSEVASLCRASSATVAVTTQLPLALTSSTPFTTAQTSASLVSYVTAPVLSTPSSRRVRPSLSARTAFGKRNPLTYSAIASSILLTVKVTVASSASAYRSSPAWFAAISQSPALTRVMAPLEETVQTSVLREVKLTTSSLSEEANTVTEVASRTWSAIGSNVMSCSILLTVKVTVASSASANRSSPAWFAAISQSPALTRVTTPLEEIVQTSVLREVRVTARSLSDEASMITVGSPSD